MILTRDHLYVKGSSGSNELKLEFATSWLDPSGEFHPIKRSGSSAHSWLSHSDWALQNGHRLKDLFEKGWMRVVYIGDIVYASNDLDVPLTRKQINNLVDSVAMSRKFNEVVYEGSSGDRSIWRKDD